VTVSNPAHAAKLLGLDTIRALVLTYQVFSQFSQIDQKTLPLEQLMQHCLGVGSLAKMIARQENQDQGFASNTLTAGILHDTGKLILAQGFPLEYKEVIIEAKEHDMPLWLVEKDAFRTSHAEVGAYLLGLWRLPDAVVEAVAFHHEPLKGGAHEAKSLTAVYVANVIEHDEQSASGPTYTSKLDNGYLTKIGADDRVAVWREKWKQALKKNLN